MNITQKIIRSFLDFWNWFWYAVGVAQPKPRCQAETFRPKATWGDALYLFNFEEFLAANCKIDLRLYGYGQLPKFGDIFEYDATRDGDGAEMVVRCVFLSVERQHNPPDMYFASVRPFYAAVKVK